VSRYQIVSATRAHAEELAPHMRSQDAEEVGALGYAPLPALLTSLKTSTISFTGLADGKVICMFGHCLPTVLSDEAQPWLLSSREITHHARAFLRLNRQYIAGLRAQFRLLHGFVCETNTVSIRWLRWLGFTIDEEIRYPAPGKPGFHYFHLEG
jgi:hypothetical protein